MKKSKWLILIGVLLFALLIPVIPVNVVPEWPLRLVDESGQPVPNARIDQWWKDYSLEFWRWPHVDESMSSDDQGIVTFQARNIRVSVVQVVVAKMVDVITSINPHAGYGPHAHVLCRGSLNCSARYRPGEGLPRVIMVEK